MSEPIDELVAKLLPCPFCGEKEELYPGYHGMGGGKPYQIDCVGCGIEFTPREGMDVIKAWNRRAVLEASEAKAARLEAERDEARRTIAEQAAAIIRRSQREFEANLRAERAEAAAAKMDAALRKIAFMRKAGPTPKMISGTIIEQIERIAIEAFEHAPNVSVRQRKTKTDGGYLYEWEDADGEWRSYLSPTDLDPQSVRAALPPAPDAALNGEE